MSAPAPHAATPDAAGLRRFGLSTGLIFVGLFTVIPWLRHHGLHQWPLYPGGFFVGLGLAWPAALAPVYRVWMRVGTALGWVNMRVILLVVFATLLVPIGLVWRLFGHDPMGRRLARGGTASYRKPSSPAPRERLERPF